MATEFKLPELGENIESGTVARLLVSEGDTIDKGQPILEVETEKAVAEVPSPASGTITNLKVQEGQSVSVGDLICLIDGTEAKGKEEAPKKEAPEAKKEEKPEEKEAPAKAEAKKEAAEAPEEKAEARGKSPRLEVLERKEKEQQAAEPEEKREQRGARAPSRPRTGPVVASPAVRRRARELGVNLHDVPERDTSGRITMDDLMAYVEGEGEAEAEAPKTDAKARERAPARETEGAVEEDRWGPVMRRPMNAIRRKTAEHMHHAWTTIPHVTHFDKADVTSLESLRKRHGGTVEAAGGKLTVTSFLLKAVAAALQRFPKFNSSIDTESSELLFKQYFHIGVAVDTPQGLLVPVIRNVDQKSITDLSVELVEAAEKARDRKLSLEDMQGGTFTISNLGGLGGTGFTPVIHHPEVALLGVSRTQVEPVYQNGQFGPRMMLPLALSYDHRVIDGAEAARFTRWLAEAIEQPWLLFLEETD